MTLSAEAMSQLMLGAAYEALFVLNERLEIVALNNSARAMFGDVAQPGTPLTAVMESGELESMFRYVVENHERDFEVQTKVGGSFYRVRAQLHKAADDTPYIGAAFQDVTELVRLNRARRDMVANISHELRTPIANIRLIIDSLFHDADKPKRKKSIESLRVIARETDALLWLVQELLDLSMIESGQAIVRMVDVNVHEMAAGAVERMQEQAENRDITLAADIPETLNALCDSDLSQRVLINLLHNAIKYAPEGSKVRVTADAADEYVTITVKDKGPGVPGDQTERIFERFYQVDASRTRTREGTGLGLAICKHIVEAHGGRIWAEPAEDVGGGQLSFSLLNADHSHDDDL
jgi:two-component system, OmpR family, phosphate regulon sensor histidine kinase PhoR